jgi:hypothetical protein
LENYAEKAMHMLIIRIIVGKSYWTKKLIRNLWNHFILKCSERKRKPERKPERSKGSNKLRWKRQMTLIIGQKSPKR